ncbi:putative ribonuclease H-like domain-containing protein, partial [Tanacetum coccineum]
NPQQEDQGYVDSGCSRHMIRNMSYLLDFKEFDRGHVTFGGGAKGERITGKGTLKTGKLDFEDVYFVKELQFNLFSISQMCDKKNSVLFIDTRCFVLSPDFKLADESQVLLKIPIKNNMYNVDMNNIIPKESLTCLVAKATLDDNLIENLVDKKVKAEAVNTACYVQNRVLVVKPYNKTPYELFRGRTPSLSFMRPFGCHVTILNTLDHLGKFDGKSDDGFFVGYSVNSKVFRVYNIRTRKVEENLHVRFLEDKPIIAGNGPKWLFDIDVLTKSMNCVLVVVGTNSNDFVGTTESIGVGHSNKEPGSSQDYILMPLWKDGSLFDSSLKNTSNDEPQPSNNARKKDDESRIDQEKTKDSTQDVNTVEPSINTGSINFNIGSLNTNTINPTVNTAPLEDTHAEFFGDETEVDMSNISTTYPVPSTPNTRIHKDHSLDNVIGDVQSSVQTRRMTKTSNEQGFISTVYEGKTHEDLYNCLFACFLSQEEPKKVIQALKDLSWIEAMQEELLQFKLQQVWTLMDLPYGKRAIGTKWVYRNKKDKRGIMIRNKARLIAQGYTQEEGMDYDEVFAPVARIEAIRLFLAYTLFKDFIVYQMDVKSAFLYDKIEEEVYVYQPPGFEDLEFPNKVYKVEKALYGLHQAPKAYLGLQVTQKDDGIFISQDKYVDEILKKFGFLTVKITSTPMETSKSLLKDSEAEDVDVYLYRSMIGLLMYLTASRPDIMFVDSLFDLEAYTDSDYAGASLDRKSTTGGCQFLGSRLISWQCKKQTIVSTSTTEAEYVAASNETVIKEWEDRMERAATIASSLKAEQDNGNINRTQSMAILNGSLSQGTDSGSGPRCQDTILGGAEAQIRLNLLLPILVYAARHLLTAVRHKLMLPGITYYCWNASYVQYALTVNPTIYTTCVEQFRTSAKVKTVNGERQIQSLVDKKKVIIIETSIRSDLKLDDAEGTNCLPTATIFAELERMGYKNLTQKLTFYKANFSSQWKFLIYTILQCLSAKTTAWSEFSSTMTSAIICLATNKKFNISKYNSDNMVKNLEGGVKFLMYPRFVQVFLDKQVEGMTRHKEVYVTPSHTKKVFANIKRPGKGFSGRGYTPLISTIMVQVQEVMGDDLKIQLRKQRKDNGFVEPVIDEAHVSTPSYDPPQSDSEIRKVGSANRVESSNDVSLGAQEDASKQGRKIADLDADAEVTMVDETQGRNDDDLMFDIDILDDDKTLIEIKSTKPKAITTDATTVTPISTRPKAKWIVFYDQVNQAPTSKPKTDPAQPSSKDKGKSKMVEPKPEKKTKRKTQIQLDEELAFKIHAEEQAKLERMQRERVEQEEASRAAVIEELDSIQAMIDADEKLAARLQAEEQEQFSIEEKIRMLVEMIAERKRFFAAQRAVEQRSKPPTKAQIRNRMCTYLKNIGGFKHNQLKGRSYEEIQKLFDKVYTQVNSFVPMESEGVKGSEARTEESSKREGDELESNKSKKQKVDEHVEAEKDDDLEEEEMKKHMEIVQDEEEIAIDAIPLATKPPMIVEYKIVKEGQKGFYHLIRADESSKRYSSMIMML